MSKCWAVLGPAFAGMGRELGGWGEVGVRIRQCGALSVGLGRWVGCANGAECSASVVLGGSDWL